MAKKRKPQKVIVTWKDSQSFDEWEHLEDVVFSPLPVIESHGFLIYEDKEQIYLAQNMSEDHAISMLMQIPKGCIVKIRKA